MKIFYLSIDITDS